MLNNAGSASRRCRRATLPVLVLALLVVACQRGAAKTLYVDGAKGNDSTTYASNGPNTPWKTIGRAAWGSTTREAPNALEAAKAGDVVRIAAGTYSTVGGGDRWDVAYNPANKGRADAPIRFEGQGVVTLVYSSGDGPIIGAKERDYIEWSGFTISEATAPSQPDTSQVVFFGAQGGSIENSTLTGNPNWPYRVGDNYSAIRVHASRGQRIVNNHISSYNGQSGDENQAGITTYWVGDLTIEHNEIDNCGSGIYLKGNNRADPVSGWFKVRYNLIRNNHEGIRILLIPSKPDAPNIVAQNIFRDNQYGLLLVSTSDGAPAPRNAKILNNTFVGNVNVGFHFLGTHVGDAAHVFHNNIVVGGAVGMHHQPFGPATLLKNHLDSDHNVFNGSGTSHGVLSRRFGVGNWKGEFKQDVASLQADPRFQDPAKHDYHLRAGSPALTAGRALFGVGGADGTQIPAGAYITGSEVIGRQTAAN